MSGDVVGRAKAALEGVTDGPWQVERWEDFSGHVVSYSLPDIAQWSGYRNTVDCGGDKALAEFIAAARSLVPELVAEVEKLRNLDDDYSGLLIRQGELLTGVVNAIRGNPRELTTWSHHDAPELARELVAEVERLRARETKMRALALRAAVSSNPHEYVKANQDILAVLDGEGGL